MIFLVGFGFVLGLAIKDFLAFLLFSFSYILYLSYRFKNKIYVLFFCIISIFSFSLKLDIEKTPEIGDYQITEIRNGYAYAQNQDCKVMIQNLEGLSFHDVIYIDSFEKVHTDDNFNLFSFTNYLNQKKIFYKAKSYEVKNISQSIKSCLYRYLSSRKKASTYLSLYYQIHDDSITSLFTQLGCGIISSYYLLEKMLKRKFNEEKVRFTLVLCLILYGYFFIYSLALVRLILYQIFKSFHLSKENTLGLLMIAIGILMPYEITSFGFVFPIVYSFSGIYLSKNKYIVQKCILISMMFIYFKKVDLISLLLFNWIRKGYGFCFIVGWIPNMTLSSINIYYAPGLLFIVCFLCFIYFSMKHFKWKYLFIFMIPFIEIYCNPFFQVYSINIGQGDCTLIVEPFQKSAVMIDCGQSLYRDNVEKIIYPFLQNLNIHKLNCLLLTHDDYDHSGGYEKLNECISIDKVIKNSKDTVNVSYPFYSLLSKRHYDDENNKSIVSYFSYDSFTFLWMADAGVDVEKDLLNIYSIDCDFLKLGHHGSNTSSSYDFLKKMNPKLSIISVGYKNKYNHPHVEVMKRLHDLGIASLSTKDCGSIAIYTFKDFAFVRTQDGIFGIIRQE